MKKIILILVLVVIVFFTTMFLYTKQKNSLTPSTLNGSWYSYMDCPTEILTFGDNQKVTLGGCDSEYNEHSSTTVSYKIIENKAIAQFDTDMYELALEQGNDKKLSVTRKSGVTIFSKKIE